MKIWIARVVILFLVVSFYTTVSYAEDSRKLHKKQNSRIEKSNSALKNIPSGKEAMEGKRDSVGDLSEVESIRLQMQMDRRAKAAEAQSNLLKSASDTNKAITDNIK